MSPPPPPPAQAGSRVQVLVNLAAGTSASAVTAMQQELQAAVSSGQLADSLRVAGAPASPEDMRWQPQRACHVNLVSVGRPQQRICNVLALPLPPLRPLRRCPEEKSTTACGCRRRAGSPRAPTNSLRVGGARPAGRAASACRQDCAVGVRAPLSSGGGAGTQPWTEAACAPGQGPLATRPVRTSGAA